VSATEGLHDLERTLAAIERHPRWRVVLLKPRTKRPAGARWQVTREGTTIATHIKRGGNLGAVCHETTGLAVLDADDLISWADMIDTLGQPAAAWTETGRGRLHYFFRWEPGLPAKIQWKSSILGECQRSQQQVVVPPSIHPDTGRRYRWIVDPTTQPLEPLPGVWRAYLRGQTYARGHR
jgi:Bifunctional DNA primase/polymerase, N-terminal